jgi:CRISPR-associated protein Csb2
VAPALLDDAGDAPDLIYRWSVPDDQARLHLPALDELASRLLALGWGIDLATALVALDGAPTMSSHEVLIPTERGGRPMRTLRPGLLGHLRECHEAARSRVTPKGVNPFTRPTDFPLTRYRKVMERELRPWCAFGLQCLDGEPFSVDWRRARDVAAWLRHMAGEAMGEEFDAEDKAWIDSFVMGHTAEHELGVRLSYLPLPSIGHPNSDGAIRRAMIVGPPGATGRDAEAIELLRIKAPGRVLSRAGDRRPEAVLVAGLRDPMVRRYCDPGRHWRSVTPVVLHGHNAGRKGLSVRKTERLLFQALETAGYPVEAVQRLSFQTAPYWAGCSAAAAIKTPRHLDRRPRLHVAIDFNCPVEGPLAIGLGRHYGIGLFASVER